MEPTENMNKAAGAPSALNVGLAAGALWPWVAELGDALKAAEKIAAKGGAYGLAGRLQKLADLLIESATEDECICTCNNAKI